MRYPWLSELKIQLTPEQAQHAESMLTIMYNQILYNNSDDIELLSDVSLSFHPHVLIWLCQQNSEIEKFFRSNPVVLHKISKVLANNGHFVMEVKSMDKRLCYSVFDLFLAAKLMRLFADTHTSGAERMMALNNACMLGSNDALLARCRYHEQILKQSNKPQEQRNSAWNGLLTDIKQLTNLYWGFGYMQAGCLLHALGETHPSDNADLMAMAIQHFLCAAQLEENEYSAEVLNTVTLGKGMAALFKKQQFAFAGWEMIVEVFKNQFAEQYPEIEANAQKELASVVRAAAINVDLHATGRILLSEFYVASEQVMAVGVQQADAGLKQAAVHFFVLAYLILKDLSDERDPSLILTFHMLGLNVQTWEEAKIECMKWVNHDIFMHEQQQAESVLKNLVAES